MTQVTHAGVAELADAADSKSLCETIALVNDRRGTLRLPLSPAV